MSTTKQDAAQNLRRLAVMFSGIVALADDMDTLDALAQGTEGAQKRCDEARAAEAAAKADLAAALDAVTKAKADADAIMAHGHGVYDKMLEQAKSEAQEIRNRGVEEANTTRANAEADAKAIDAELADKRAQSAAFDEATAAQQKQLDDLNKALDKLKAKFAA